MQDQRNNVRMEVAFLDVGQGDCTVGVGYETETVILIDCGKAQPAMDFLAAPDRNKAKVRLLAITHLHLDHCVGFMELLPVVDLSNLEYCWLSPLVPLKKELGKDSRAVLKRIREAIRQKADCPPAFVNAGRQAAFGSLKIDVLHPTADDMLDVVQGEYRGPSTSNDMCLVLQLTYRIDGTDHRVLIGGDAEGAAWRRIMSRSPDISADVFRLPHHGNWFSESEESVSLSQVIDTVRPKWAIISVGSANQHGHPDEATIDALRKSPHVERVLCTQATSLCTKVLDKNNYSCAGDTIVSIRSHGLQISPSALNHQQTKNLLDTSRCRESF